MKKIIVITLAVLIMAVSLIVPISAATEEVYTSETVNHLRYDKICELMNAESVINSETGKYTFTNVTGGTPVSDILGEDELYFECGTLIEFIPTLQPNVEYTIFVDNGGLLLNYSTGAEGISGTRTFTEEDLQTPLLWHGVQWHFDLAYTGQCISLNYPIVVQGEFDIYSLTADTWRPFYDTVTVKNYTVWDKYPTLNILPYDYSHVATTKYGVTFTVNYDGTLVLNGTVSAEKGYASFIFLQNASVLMPDTVTLSAFTGGSKETYYIQPVFSGTWGAVCTDTKTYDTAGKYLEKVIFYAMNGVTFENFVIKPMLNAGDTAYPFQPYLAYHFEQEYNNGYGVGYEKGMETGFNNGYAQGDSAGYDRGLADGEAYGYENGYTVGKADGEGAGYDVGYQNGYDDGAAEQYSLGYAAGEQSTVTRDFKDIISEIAFAPYRAVSSMFDFEVFGINIAGAIFTVFTLLVLLLIVGFVVKLIF